MIKLYYSPASTAMGPHAALEEAGAEYELVEVDIDCPLEERDPEYLKINPHARVPTLDDDGVIVYEGAAIMLYIAERFPHSDLAPPVGDRTRGLYLQWLVYMADTLQVAFQMHYYPERHTTNIADLDNVKAKAAERLEEIWRVLNAGLQTGPYLLGERFSGCDLYLHMLTTWHQDPRALLDRFSNIKCCVELVEKRPAVRRIMKVHGPSWVTHHPDDIGPL